MLRSTVSVLILVALFSVAARSQTIEKKIEDFEQVTDVWSGAFKVVSEGSGNHVARWDVPPDGKAHFLYFSFSPKDMKIAEWDWLRFRYKALTAPTWFGLKIVDYPLADGYQAVWRIRPQSDAMGTWQTAQIDLQGPEDRWDRPNKTSHFIALRAEQKSGQPFVVLFDDITLIRRRVAIEILAPNAQRKSAWPETRIAAIKNRGARPTTLLLEVRSLSPQLRVSIEPEKLTIPPASERKATVRLEWRPDTPPFSRHRCVLRAISPHGSSENLETETTMTITAPLKRIPHPCLLFTKKDLPRIRERLETWEGGKRWWTSLKKRADAWLKRTPKFPDRGSQWWHWYTCKKCGSRLRTESPTRHVCPNCGEVYSGWPYDDVVLARDHSRLASAARELAIAYQITGDKRYAAKAREILVGYAERYLKYPLHDIHGKPSRGGGHVGPQTLDEAVWLIPIAQAFDAIQETLAPSDRQWIAEKLLLPAAKLIKDHQWGIHNICCWHASAYGLVGLALDDPELAEAAINGPKGFRAQVEKGVTDDGEWYERAWGYHFYTMSALEPLAVAAHNLGIDVFSSKYKGLYDAPLHFLTPTNELPAFNDSGRTRFAGAGMAARYEPAYNWWGDPLYATVIKQGGRASMAAVLWGADTVEAGRASRFTSAVYPSAGTVVLRTNPPGTKARSMPLNYLALDFGEHGGGHGHPDKLNFVLWGYGELLAEDPGCIAYGNPAHRGWYRQTLSHNTVVVDGHSQKACTGKLLFAAFGENAGIFCATADAAYPGVHFGRAMAMAGNLLLDICWLSSTEKHTYDWCFHSRGKMTTELPLKPTRVPRGDGYAWAKEWRAAPIKDPWAAAWRTEKGTTLAVAQARPKGELLSAIGMGNPPTVHFPMVVSRAREKALIYRTAFVIGKDSAPHVEVKAVDLRAEAGKPCLGMEARTGKLRAVWIVLPEGGAVSFEDRHIQGQGALLVYENGKPTVTLVSEGARP